MHAQNRGHCRASNCTAQSARYPAGDSSRAQPHARAVLAFPCLAVDRVIDISVFYTYETLEDFFATPSRCWIERCPLAVYRIMQRLSCGANNPESAVWAMRSSGSPARLPREAQTMTARVLCSSIDWSRTLSTAGLFCLGLLAGGCASKSSAPLAPATVSLAQYKYLIGPGDTLSVIVWRNPDLSMSVPVRPDGKISLPLVEDLPAAGKDPDSGGPRRRARSVQVHSGPRGDRHRDAIRGSLSASRSGSSDRPPSRRPSRTVRT